MKQKITVQYKEPSKLVSCCRCGHSSPEIVMWVQNPLETVYRCYCPECGYQIESAWKESEAEAKLNWNNYNWVDDFPVERSAP